MAKLSQSDDGWIRSELICPICSSRTIVVEQITVEDFATETKSGKAICACGNQWYFTRSSVFWTEEDIKRVLAAGFDISHSISHSISHGISHGKIEDIDT